MENIAIFRINYKSDFILTLQSDAGWMTPFCIKFWTGAPSQAYFARWDGTTYTNCEPVEGEPTKLRVQFDDHKLPIGTMKYQVGYHFTVSDFPTTIEDEVINQADVIIEVDGEPAQVMLDFNGETAPEIEFSLPAYANEAQRIANESQRIANEEQRIATETQRIANEEQRISQEQTRQQNEVQRIVQEQARVTAERERFNDYAKLKADAIAATDAANSAADLANEKAQLAADNAQLAADKAALAQSASALATEKAQLATDKAALAQSAATLANEKAALAQQKAEYATAQGDYAKAQGDYAKAQAGVIPTDVTRTQTDATFVNGNHDPLFYLHQANSSLAGLMTAAGYTKLNDMPAAQEVNAGLAYDVSVLHPTSGVSGGSTYASLSAALAVIPQDKRKGGMTVKFVQSSDNKYVQYLYKVTDAATAATFTNVANWEKVNLEESVKSLEQVLNDLSNSIQDRDGDTLYITDSLGNVVAKFDSSGVHAIDVEAGGVKLKELSQVSAFKDIYEDAFFALDNDGNVIFSIDENGIHTTKIEAKNAMPNLWGGKILATYGDSITAQTNGDFVYPYDNKLAGKWGNIVAKLLYFEKQYGRGVGSTCFAYGASGGQVAWCKTATGEYVDRNDSYTYDNYEGHVTIPSDCTPIRGNGSSWLRITTMFPASIKDTIDAVLVMFHNDYAQDTDTDVVWIENDTTDPEWAESDEYATLGGDYNIGTVKGGIASTIMKLQAWMPNARLILMTPMSGIHATIGALDGNFDNGSSAKMLKLAKCVKDVAERMSIPCIDNYGNDGINSLNRTTYISDRIHPNTAGGDKLAMSVTGGLIGIVPNIEY